MKVFPLSFQHFYGLFLSNLRMEESRAIFLSFFHATSHALFFIVAPSFFWAGREWSDRVERNFRGGGQRKKKIFSLRNSIRITNSFPPKTNRWSFSDVMWTTPENSAREKKVVIIAFSFFFSERLLSQKYDSGFFPKRFLPPACRWSRRSSFSSSIIFLLFPPARPNVAWMISNRCFLRRRRRFT